MRHASYPKMSDTINNRIKTRMDEAIIEAERFIRKAKAVKATMSGDWHYGRKEHAAARRASMDLTRALVQVRASL